MSEWIMKLYIYFFYFDDFFRDAGVVPKVIDYLCLCDYISFLMKEIPYCLLWCKLEIQILWHAIHIWYLARHALTLIH